MSVKGWTLGAPRDGRGMTAKRKRFCRRCRTRVSRSASRCGYCGQRMLNPARLALAAFISMAVLFVLVRALSFF